MGPELELPPQSTRKINKKDLARARSYIKSVKWRIAKTRSVEKGSSPLLANDARRIENSERLCFRSWTVFSARRTPKRIIFVISVRLPGSLRRAGAIESEILLSVVVGDLFLGLP